MASYPIFFSVSSKDTAFAEDLLGRFPADWIYLWSTTGRDWADLWDEIEVEQLPSCRLFVIFWSKNYLNSKGCVRELRAAEGLKRLGILEPLVIRLDHHPLHWNKKLRGQTKKDFALLDTMLNRRTSGAAYNIDQAEALLQKAAEATIRPKLPIIPRPHVSARLKKSLEASFLRYKPSLWLSGFNGTGRRTEVNRLTRQLLPNAVTYEIPIDETTIPKQALLRLADKVHHYSADDIDELNAKMDNECLGELIKQVRRICDAGNVVIFKHNTVLLENSQPPDWVDDVLRSQGDSTKTQIYLVSTSPLFGERLQGLREKTAYFRLPTLTDQESEELVKVIAGAASDDVSIWTEDMVQDIVKNGYGNAELLKLMVLGAAGFNGISDIKEVLEVETARITSSIDNYAKIVFKLLHGRKDHLRVLYLLDSLSPLLSPDIEAICKPSGHLPIILNELKALGVIEQDESGLIQNTPMLSLVSFSAFNDNALRDWVRNAIKVFADEPLHLSDGNTYLAIETKIQASLDSDIEVPERFKKHVLGAHLFKGGVVAYRSRQFFKSHKLLRRAFENRHSFTDETRLELLRYFGLAAVRTKEHEDLTRVIEILRSNHNHRDMALFLEGFKLQEKAHYDDALKLFRQSLDASNGRASRLIHLHRHLVACSLKSRRTDYEQTLKWAEEAVAQSENPQTLCQIGTVCISWLNNGYASEETGQKLRNQLDYAKRTLLRMPEGIAEHFVLDAEEFVEKKDFRAAVSALDNIPSPSIRIHHRTKRWSYMARSMDDELSSRCIKELQKFRDDEKNLELFKANEYRLVEIFIRCHRQLKLDFKRSLDRFALAISESDRGRVIARLRREI